MMNPWNYQPKDAPRVEGFLAMVENIVREEMNDISTTNPTHAEYLKYCLENEFTPSCKFLSENQVQLVITPEGRAGEIMAIHLYSKIPTYFKRRMAGKKANYAFDKNGNNCTFTFE